MSSSPPSAKRTRGRANAAAEAAVAPRKSRRESGDIDGEFSAFPKRTAHCGNSRGRVDYAQGGIPHEREDARQGRRRDSAADTWLTAGIAPLSPTSVDPGARVDVAEARLERK